VVQWTFVLEVDDDDVVFVSEESAVVSFVGGVADDVCSSVEPDLGLS
jgi:hypothetical protein